MLCANTKVGIDAKLRRHACHGTRQFSPTVFTLLHVDVSCARFCRNIHFAKHSTLDLHYSSMTEVRCAILYLTAVISRQCEARTDAEIFTVASSRGRNIHAASRIAPWHQKCKSQADELWTDFEFLLSSRARPVRGYRYLASAGTFFALIYISKNNYFCAVRTRTTKIIPDAVDSCCQSKVDSIVCVCSIHFLICRQYTDIEESLEEMLCCDRRMGKDASNGA